MLRQGGRSMRHNRLYTDDAISLLLEDFCKKKQEHLKLQKDGCGLEPGVSTRVPTEDQLRH